MLPDGNIIVTGGQKVAHVFTDTDGATAAELFNPYTKTWKTLGKAAVARNCEFIQTLPPCLVSIFSMTQLSPLGVWTNATTWKCASVCHC